MNAATTDERSSVHPEALTLSELPADGRVSIIRKANVDGVDCFTVSRAIIRYYGNHDVDYVEDAPDDKWTESLKYQRNGLTWQLGLECILGGPWDAKTAVVRRSVGRRLLADYRKAMRQKEARDRREIERLIREKSLEPTAEEIKAAHDAAEATLRKQKAAELKASLSKEERRQRGINMVFTGNPDGTVHASGDDWDWELDFIGPARPTRRFVQLDYYRHEYLPPVDS